MQETIRYTTGGQGQCAGDNQVLQEDSTSGGQGQCARDNQVLQEDRDSVRLQETWTYSYKCLLIDWFRLQHYDVRVDWYPYTGQEAPMPLDDIEIDADDDEEEEDNDDDDDDDDGEMPDFVNFWNQMPGPPQFRDIPLS